MPKIRTLLLALVALTIAPNALGQPANQDALVSAVTNAEAAVTAAEAELQAAHAAGDPLLAEYHQALADRDRASEVIDRALDAVDTAQDRVDRLPITLTAREAALTDVLTRMYQRGASTDDPDVIRREAELTDVKRQIAELQVGIDAARRRVDQRFANKDAAFAARNRLDAKIARIELDARSAKHRIEAAQDALAAARDALERARSEARWRLNEDPPPSLISVKAQRGRTVFYEAEWVDPAEEIEELLRLAQYLHTDLGRTLPLRRQRVDEWIDIVTADQAAANAAMTRYTDLIGGSSDGALGWVESALDSVTFGYGGALVTGGSLTWRKIGVELGDAALSVLRDIYVEGVPPHTAIAVEAVFQVGDALLRDGPKNPSWDVTKMPTANDAIRSSQPTVSGTQEQALFQSINATSIRSALERMRSQVRDDLDGEDFREKLLRNNGGMTLAAAFTEATFYAQTPNLNVDDRPILGASPADWVFTQFTSPTGQVKTLIKEAMFSDPSDRNNPKSMFLDALQAAVRDGILEQLERERLEAWSDYLMADVEVRLSVANLRNEGRVRRMDEKIRKTLADEVIPALTREVENRRGERRLDILKDAGVTGRTAKLTLTFSRPVIVESVVLGEVTLEPAGDGDIWTTDFKPGDFDVAQATLTVMAKHAALEDRQLDDPATVATWSNQDNRFNAYEPGPDIYHKIKLDPPEGVGFAIVLDTSGSMEDNGRIGQAKTALENLFTSGRITSNDQVALYTYGGCGVSETVPFTDDIALVQDAVANAGTGGDTPLASSITVASTALAAQNVERGVLVVVTDGEDSCDGTVVTALREARERVDSIRRRLVR